MDIETIYIKRKGEEEHYRFDTETSIYKLIYGLIDLNPMVNEFIYQSSCVKQGKNE